MRDARLRWALTPVASGVALMWSGCTGAANLGPDGGGLDGRARDSADAHALDAHALDGTPRDSADATDAEIDLPSPGPIRVLFIGDRYTRDNDLPEIVRQVAATPPDSVTVELESVVVDGATLRDHVATTGARGRIRDGHFDVVVIQGESTEPLRPDSEFRASAATLDQEVTAAGARLVWFVTWPRRPGHADYALPYLVDPREMTYALDGAYDFEYVSDGVLVHQHGILAHVGIAFRLAIVDYPEIDLYAPDGSHPSAAGSVLAGCVLSQMITGTTPRVPRPAPAGVSHEAAETLCAMAGRVACRGGLTFCGGECVSLATDALHCGACGNLCPGDLPCVAARCHCFYPEHSPCPGRVCRHLSLDEENCGACGVRCEPGQTCESSSCVCQPESTLELSSWSTLTALRPGCVPDSEYWQPECFAAVSAHCASLSCFDTGVGPTLDGKVTCLTGDLRTVTYSSLAAIVPECTGAEVATGQACVSAIHRFCVAAGAASGFGPVDGDGTSIQVACVPEATLVTTSFADLSREWPRCDGTSARGGRDCAYASHEYCSRGIHRAGGYGPIEVSGDSATIVCLGSYRL